MSVARGHLLRASRNGAGHVGGHWSVDVEVRKAMINASSVNTPDWLNGEDPMRIVCRWDES